MKKVKETTLRIEKIIRMTFLKILKTKKLPQKHPKTKNSKNFKKSCEEASNEKSSENKL